AVVVAVATQEPPTLLDTSPAEVISPEQVLVPFAPASGTEVARRIHLLLYPVSADADTLLKESEAEAPGQGVDGQVQPPVRSPLGQRRVGRAVKRQATASKLKNPFQ